MIPKPKRIKDDLILQEFRTGQCVVCHRDGVDPCHIKSKGSGGPDAAFNLIKMCREHHSMQHQLGWLTFIGRFPIMVLVLKSKGWSLSEADGLTHPRLQQP